MAAEILCTRWTVVLIRELVAGSTRFNDLRRGVPKMSPTLLSLRLRELECAGIIERHAVRGSKGVLDYRLTEAGRELQPLIEAMGTWGQRWIQSSSTLTANLDPTLLMWDMRRNLKTTPLPNRRSVIEFHFEDAPRTSRSWWLVVEPRGDVDLCGIDPGFDVDLLVSTNLPTMTSIWMGLTTVSQARRQLEFSGDREIARSMQAWLGLSPFASVPRRATA
jgi:DNA-binding HxlR family transcriptional regulator